MVDGSDHNHLAADKSEVIMAKMLENLYTQVVSTSPITIQKGPEVAQLVL